MPKKCITWSISNRISNQCVAYSPPLQFFNPKHIINPNEVAIAVKTTKKYHHTRVLQIYQLWANTKYLSYNSTKLNPHCSNHFNSISHLFKPFINQSIHIDFLSDHDDQIHNIQIQDLKTGNQPRGHCLKLYTIIHFLYNKYIVNKIHSNYNNVKYFVLADDDTLIIPFSLLNLLTFINHHQQDNHSDLYLGLRYSFGSILDNWAIDYITGTFFCFFFFFSPHTHTQHPPPLHILLLFYSLTQNILGGGSIIINSNSLQKLVNCKGKSSPSLLFYLSLKPFIHIRMYLQSTR